VKAWHARIGGRLNVNLNPVDTHLLNFGTKTDIFPVYEALVRVALRKHLQHFVLYLVTWQDTSERTSLPVLHRFKGLATKCATHALHFVREVVLKVLSFFGVLPVL